MIAKTLSLCALLLSLQPDSSNIEKNIVHQKAEFHKKFNSIYGDYSLVKDVITKYPEITPLKLIEDFLGDGQFPKR